MSPENISVIVHRLDEIKQDIEEVRDITRQTNGRVKELELWRAQLSGAAKTIRIGWIAVGAIATALIIDFSQYIFNAN